MGRIGEQPQGEVLHAHPSGRAQLCKEKRKWNKAFSAVNRLLEAES